MFTKLTGAAAAGNKQGYQHVDMLASSDNGAASVKAHITGAQKEMKTSQKREGRHQKKALGASPSGVPKQASNEGRIVVSQDTLLRWLCSKAACDV